MALYRISAVSYANTLPYVYGLTRCPDIPPMALSFDYPARCAEKIISGEADIGLIPVAVLSELDYYEILPGFCLGATGKVRTVLLVSTVPLSEIRQVRLDYQSRSSVQLARLLARDFWKISPVWIDGRMEDDQRQLEKGEARVLIGDRTFAAEKQYPYCYDLAEAWVAWTGLPFVFAAWVANKSIDPAFVKQFTYCLRYGVNNIPEASRLAEDNPALRNVNMVSYLSENLSYLLDNSKLRGLKLFREKILTLS
jgi:chorismate dehydratase